MIAPFPGVCGIRCRGYACYIEVLYFGVRKWNGGVRIPVGNLLVQNLKRFVLAVIVYNLEFNLLNIILPKPRAAI